MTAEAVIDADRVQKHVRTRSADGSGSRSRFGSAGRIGAAVLVLAQMIVGVSNLGFHVITSRLLGPSGYGEFGSLLAIIAVLIVPATAVETLVTARVAQRLERGEPVAVAATNRHALAAGVGGAVLLLVLAPVLRDYLSLGSVAPLVYLALYCLPLSAALVPWGVLCGQRRFATAGGIALGSALTRLAFAALFISWGCGVAGAIAASVCSDSLRAILLTVAARTRLVAVNGQNVRPVRLGGGRTVASVVAFAGLWLLTGADSMLARHLFTPVVAGQYNAAAMTARGVYFVSQALCLIAVPAFASADRRRAARALRRTLLATAGVGLSATAGFTVCGADVLSYVFGRGFDVPSAVMTLVGLAATGLAVLWVLVQYQLAGGGPAWSAWTGLLIAVVQGSLWATTPETLAVTMIVASSVAIAIGAWGIRRHNARQVRPSMTAPGPLAVVPPDGVDLTVVVPFYNPGDALRPNLLNLVSALRASGVTFEVIAVADGCTDGSAATIADLDPRVVRRLILPRNGGKGAALRLGLREGRGRYLGFIDADGDLDPKLWQPFLTLMRLYEPDAVIGAKEHPLSEVDLGPSGIRRFYSAGYRLLVRLLFPDLRVRETQVGIKVFRRELLADVLPRTVERGFVFDLELLTVAHRLGYRRLLSAPVRLQRSGPSTITARAVWRMFADTVALAWRVWAGKAYDAVPTQQAGPGQAESQDAAEDTIAIRLPRLGFREGW